MRINICLKYDLLTLAAPRHLWFTPNPKGGVKTTQHEKYIHDRSQALDYIFLFSSLQEGRNGTKNGLYFFNFLRNIFSKGDPVWPKTVTEFHFRIQSPIVVKLQIYKKSVSHAAFYDSSLERYCYCFHFKYKNDPMVQFQSVIIIWAILSLKYANFACSQSSKLSIYT